MLPGHKIHDSVACTVDGILTVRSATILQNTEGCVKVYSKNNTQHRRLWKNWKHHTAVCGIKKLLKGYKGRKIERNSNNKHASASVFVYFCVCKYFS